MTLIIRWSLPINIYTYYYFAAYHGSPKNIENLLERAYCVWYHSMHWYFDIGYQQIVLWKQPIYMNFWWSQWKKNEKYFLYWEIFRNEIYKYYTYILYIYYIYIYNIT